MNSSTYVEIVVSINRSLFPLSEETSVQFSKGNVQFVRAD